MNKYSIIVLLLSLASIFSCKKDNDNGNPPANSVTYEVNFYLDWNSTAFPISYASNAHFSKLIGWSHQPGNSFFKVGTMASEGIENMAETGGTSPLDVEINTKIAQGDGLSLAVGSGLGTGTGAINMDVYVDINNSSVTLATMIAPSPDWYVAVVDINLLENEEFVNEKIVPGLVYDAGTDNGTTYTSGDEETNPQEPISLFVDPPLGDGTTVTPFLAVVKFTKK